MIITLPFLPPSCNRIYYSDFKSRTRHKTSDYRRFQKDCAPFIPQTVKPLTGAIRVEYNFYFPDHRKRDVANFEKAMTDTLVEYGIIEDYSMIVRMVLEKYYQKGKPETVCQVTLQYDKKPEPTRKEKMRFRNKQKDSANSTVPECKKCGEEIRYIFDGNRNKIVKYCGCVVE